jgi:hypothetical protein
MLNAPSIAPRDSRLVRREIQKIRDALEAFRAAIEAGEMTGFKHEGLRAD